VRRLALLATGGALWLFLFVVPVFADGGPHVLANNNGTGAGGLAGDCAACHRAHTAQAADLLKEELPGLCLSCHNGTGATVDVVDGFQYEPDTNGTPTTTVLGALRGGGFSYALIGDPARLNYSSRGGIVLAFGASATGSVTLTWPAFTGFAGGTLTFDASDSAATVQTAANTLFLTSPAYTTSTATANMSLPTGFTGQNIQVTKSTSGTTIGNFTFTPNNAFKLQTIPLPTVTANATGLTATVTNGISIGGDGHVAVLAAVDKEITTSNHMGGLGTVWGNGPQGQGNAGATGVVLDCAKCHNPHGNGQYRILQTEPGEDWDGLTGVVDWTPPAQPVSVADVAPATLATGEVRNYTVRPSSDGLTSGVIGTADQGDYWRYKYDPSGAANFTNFYLKPDQMNTGWVGSAVSIPTLTNATGAMTAWCVQCHTRYNGYFVNPDGTPTGTASGGTPSLNLQTPSDATFMYKHGTVRLGCMQCHVSHGSNRVMVDGTASADVAWPGDGFDPGTGNADSRLLKVNNRGTCQLCHDPTGTVPSGTTVGTVPGALTPGP
jgi:predicted CXXCH cytochrome family protein